MGKINDMKNKQNKGRLTIAAIAAAIGISGAALTNGYNSVPTNPNNETQVVLDKDALLSEANEKLFDIVYGENRDEAKYFVRCEYDRHSNATSVSVGRQKAPISQALEYKTEIGYTYNNKDSKNNSYFEKASEVQDLLDNIIKIRESENPSQKDLEKLDKAIEALEDKNFELDGKNIVPVKEQDTELEL